MHDHLKLNLINKEFYFKKIQNNEEKFKNLLKIIQSTVLNKKNKDKDIIDIFSDLRTKLLILNEDKKEKKSKVNNNSYVIIENNNIIKNINNENIDGKIENNINKKKEDKYKENNIINDINNNNINIDELPFLEFERDFYSNTIFDKIDKKYIINPKKEFMKTIFGAYFEKSFFSNNTFQKMKILYLN